MIPAIDLPETNNRVVNQTRLCNQQERNLCFNDFCFPTLIEKSVIIHRDENGFGLRVKGQAPVFIEHVHENGSAWRAGVRKYDRIRKVNGTLVTTLDHKDVVLMFKSCTRFVGLTLLSSVYEYDTTSNQSKPDSSSVISSACSNIFLGIPKSLALPEDSSSWAGSIGRLRKDLNKIAANSDKTYYRFSMERFQPFNSSLASSDPSQFAPNPLRVVNGSPNGSSINSPTISPPQVSPTRTNKHQTTLARRCESVSARSSFLGGSGGYVANRQLYQMTNSTLLASNRFNQVSEGTLVIGGEADQHLTKRMAICINCRSLIGQNQQQTSSLNCVQCESKLLCSPEEEKQNHLRHRFYGSLRHSNLDVKKHQSRIRQPETMISDRSEIPETVGKQLPYKLSQSASTSSLPSVANNTSSIDQNSIRQPVNKRLEIIREFIDTERTHTDRLRCLNELFYRPLKNGGYMTPEQLKQVFSCHRTLYKIHRQIYRILLSANYSLYSEPMIGSALLEIFEGDLRRRLEKASCSFCSAQSTNVELLNKLTRRDTKVGEFLAQVTSQQMVGRLGIKDLLASCFQRLTKYPLLLENLLKATPQSESLDLSNKETKQNYDFPDDLNISEDEPEAAKTSRRMLAISLNEEREFIERALLQSRQILVRVNESIKVAMSHNKLKEIWKRTDKYPGVPLIDITKQQVVHEGLLTLRLSKRSFDVYVLLLNNYIIILTREGQDKYRLKFFTPEGKSSATSQGVYSPVFVIDEHLTTRDAATDENGFYLLCKRKDDSRIYEFASRSPAERLKWRDRIQWTIERQMSGGDRRTSCESTLTKSSSEISRQEIEEKADKKDSGSSVNPKETDDDIPSASNLTPEASTNLDSGEPTKIAGTISYVEDDGIVLPSNIESSQVLVDQAIQVNLLESIDKRIVS